MGSESPNAILYDYQGNELALQNGVSIPANTPLLMIGGSDGANSRYITLDASGRVAVIGAGTAGTPAGGVVTIQGVSGGQAIPITGSVTAVNASVSTTGSTIPASATYIGGSVTTAAPTYGNDNLGALSLTTTGLLRIDGSGVTQPVAGTIVDRSTMIAGSQTGLPIIGQSSGVGRLIHVNRLGYVTPPSQTILFFDPIEGSNLSTFQWGTSVSGEAVTQTSGLITLNNGGTLTSGDYAILFSNRQYPIIDDIPIYCAYRASIIFNTNAVMELGLAGGASTQTNTAIVSNGAFFRINGAGAVTLVVASGSEKTVASNSIVSGNYYTFIVFLRENGAQFIIEDANGIPVIDTFLSIALATSDESGLTHLQSFVRVYNSALATTASKINISSHQVFMNDIVTGKTWGEQMAGTSRSSAIDPTTTNVTMQLASGLAPTQSTPTSSASAYTSLLGGEFWLNATASSENALGVFSYQVSSPYNLIITDIWMPSPAVTTTFGATATIHEWCLIIKAAANPALPGGIRYVLGTFTLAASAAVGTIFNGPGVNLHFNTPIVVTPGTFIIVAVKALSGVATGAYRGSINFNGYFE